jgi:predicted neuraminidase
MKIIERKFLNTTTPSCHAASIAFYKNKSIYAWFGGQMEGLPDSAIYIQCDDKIYVIGDKDPIPRWNPILFPYENKLYLFVKLGRFCDSWATFIYDISDILEDNFDIKKAKYQILPAGLNGPVKTKCIVYDGLVYCGSSVETIVDWTSYCEIYSVKDGIFEYVDRSRPLTVPKKMYRDPYYGVRRSMGIIQPSLWCDGEVLHAFFRSSRGLGKIYYSHGYSRYESGIGWKDPIETKLPNPNSGIDTVYFNDRLFLAYNPSDISRNPLVISELDKEFNVMNELVVQDKVEGVTNTAELSYPYLVESDDKLNLVYTYGRSKIEHVVVEV